MTTKLSEVIKAGIEQSSHIVSNLPTHKIVDANHLANIREILAVMLHKARELEIENHKNGDLPYGCLNKNHVHCNHGGTRDELDKELEEKEYPLYSYSQKEGVKIVKKSPPYWVEVKLYNYGRYWSPVLLGANGFNMIKNGGYRTKREATQMAKRLAKNLGIPFKEGK